MKYGEVLVFHQIAFLVSIDPCHAVAILDLKRGWTGINNAHAIFRMHNLFNFEYIVHARPASFQIQNSGSVRRVYSGPTLADPQGF